MNRLFKHAVFFTLWLTGLPNLYLLLTKHRLRILNYHSICPEVKLDPVLTVSPKTFERQLDWLNRKTLIVPLAEVVQKIQRQEKFPPLSSVLTFDDGYLDNFTYAFTLIKQRAAPATFFLVPTFLNKGLIEFASHPNRPTKAALTKAAIALMKPYVSFGSHTLSHPKLSRLTTRKQYVELRDSKKLLEQITEKKIDLLAYPFGKTADFNKTTRKLAQDCCYSLAVTTIEGSVALTDNRYALKRIVVFDEPMFVFKVRFSCLIDDLLNFFLLRR